MDSNFTASTFDRRKKERRSKRWRWPGGVMLTGEKAVVTIHSSGVHTVSTYTSTRQHTDGPPCRAWHSHTFRFSLASGE